MSDDLKIEVRGDYPSFTVIPTATVIACQGNWAYVISQLLYGVGYYKEGFEWQECLAYQLRYLDDLAKNNRDVRSLLDEFEQQQQELAEAERMRKYKAQFSEKTKLRQAHQAEAWRIKVPSWWYDKYPEQRPDDYVPAKSDRRQPVYSEPPAPQPPSAATTTEAAPDTSRCHQRILVR